MLYALEDEQGGETGIAQPLAYGDYTRTGTSPYRDPPIPSPPLPVREQMETEVLTFGGGCGATRWFLGFALNPPGPGDPVIAQGPADELDSQNPDPTFLEILEERRQVRLQRQEDFTVQEAFMAACMNDLFAKQILRSALFVVRRKRLGAAGGFDLPSDDHDLGDLVIDITTDPFFRDRFRARCTESLPLIGTAPGFLVNSDAAVAAATPDFDLEIISGSGRVTTLDPTLVVEIRTKHAAIVVSDASIDIAQQEDGQRSAIGSPDSEIVITPNNPALPETTVPAGFFVTLSDTSVSAPIEFALFADGFE